MKGTYWILIAALFLVMLSACTTMPSQSWDQGNLKRNDRGCPTSVFVAPGGNLVQCDRFDDMLKALLQPQSFPKYDTLEAAAIAALKQIADKRGSSYEWGGVIGKTLDGKYAFSVPTTDFEGDNVELHHNLPPDMEIIGGYHTHPCLPQHDVEYFSPQDLLSVIFGHEQVAVMGDWCTGNVHLYTRGDAPDTEKTHGVWLTKGRIIGQFTKPVEMASE